MLHFMEANNKLISKIKHFTLKLFISAVLVAGLLYIPVAAQTLKFDLRDTRIVLNDIETHKNVLFIDDVSYLPIRIISEMLGLKAIWDANSDTIILNSEMADGPDELKKLKEENQSLKEEISKIKEVKLNGSWKGLYTASQGETGVNITFLQSIDGYKTAEFEMYPIESNPDVPKGKFIMQVEFSEETKAIQMKGTAWVEKPDNYAMVDFVGSVSGNYINGAVIYKEKVVGRFSIKFESI